VAIAFRPAAAADADAVVPLIYSSGPAAFDYVFGQGRAGRAEQFLRYAFGQAVGEFSYRSHDVAVVEGVIMGAGAVFDGRQTLRFTLAAAKQILGFYGVLSGLGVIARGLRIESVIRPPRPRELYLCHLGVAPAARGTGIGSALIGHLTARRQDALHDCVALDVAVTNPRAEALYRRLGFETLLLRRSKLSTATAMVADHRRMIRRP
jgi:ribosomal protein S18 acetylase RimI-like enzyme